MTMLKDKLKSGDSESKAEVIKNLETKLQAIQSRTDLTKTALRKIKLLKRLKNIAEGKAPAPAQNKSGMTESAKRRDRRKMAVLKSAEGQGQKEVAVKNAKKGPQAKVKNEKKKKQEVKVEKIEEQSEDEESDDDDGEEEEEEEDSGEEAVEGEDSGDEGDSGEEEEGSDDDEEGSDDDEESSEDEEVVSPPKPPVKGSKADRDYKKLKTKNVGTQETKEPNKKQQIAKPVVGLEALKKSELVTKNQSRYVVFVGNIPYDTTTGDLKEHFGSCGDIKHVRIPTEKKTSRPRGFAYVEAANEETYQKCLSKHHSQIKGRRINVLYTQGGKKKGEDKKKEMKVKNFKLGALRQQGKLLGSTKESQKRSFRRKKQKMNQEAEEH